jgi:hypothetical protein
MRWLIDWTNHKFPARLRSFGRYLGAIDVIIHLVIVWGEIILMPSFLDNQVRAVVHIRQQLGEAEHFSRTVHDLRHHSDHIVLLPQSTWTNSSRLMNS